MKRLMIMLFLLGIVSASEAVVYKCMVDRKVNSERLYTQAMLEKYQFQVIVEGEQGAVVLSRCSFESVENKVTCDRYEVDEIDRTDTAYQKIKKYYYFDGHFDVQIFGDLSFVENNGRGTIAFGKCEVVAP